MGYAKWGKIFSIVGIACLFSVVIAFLGLVIHIDNETNNYASIAQKQFPAEKGKIYSMIRYVNSTEFSLKERTHMIWAIGQLADKEALPYLQALYTDEPCNHSVYLCQYEIVKAINRCGGTARYNYQRGQRIQ